MSRQVLLINITRMGDLVQMGTLLQRLQHEWPGAAVDLVVTSGSLPLRSFCRTCGTLSALIFIAWWMKVAPRPRMS